MQEKLRSFWREIGLGLLVLVLYFFSRLVNLTLIPIFTDEAIYIRWSQIMANDASLRYLPLIDGKPPLFMWLTSALLRGLGRFHLDPLFIGRLTSVLSGLVGLTGVYFLAYQIFKRRDVAFLSSLLYLVVPFTLFYDRFTLADGLLAGICTWSVGLAILLFRTKRLDVALILGDVLGLGLLTKTPAMFAELFLPMQVILLDFKSKNLIKDFLKLVFYTVLVLGISEAIYSILRLFPLFHMIAQKNLEFIVPFSEFLKNPSRFLVGNFQALLNWETIYLTLPVSFLVLISLGLLFGKKNWTALLTFVLFGIQFIFMCLVNKVIYPRFLLTFTPLLLVLAAYPLGLFWNSRRAILKIIVLAVFIPAVFVDLQLLTDPVRAAIPDSDSAQYVNSWASGFGVIEVRKLLAGESSVNKKVVVVTEGTFGLMPYALEIYQNEYPAVSLISEWPLTDKPDTNLEKMAKNGVPIYLIVYQHPAAPPGWKVDLVAKYRQGNSDSFLLFYRVRL